MCCRLHSGDFVVVDRERVYLQNKVLDRQRSREICSPFSDPLLIPANYQTSFAAHSLSLSLHTQSATKLPLPHTHTVFLIHLVRRCCVLAKEMLTARRPYVVICECPDSSRAQVPIDNHRLTQGWLATAAREESIHHRASYSNRTKRQPRVPHEGEIPGTCSGRACGKSSVCVCPIVCACVCMCVPPSFHFISLVSESLSLGWIDRFFCIPGTF